MKTYSLLYHLQKLVGLLLQAQLMVTINFMKYIQVLKQEQMNFIQLELIGGKFQVEMKPGKKES